MLNNRCTYTTFPLKKNDQLQEPMFFGSCVNISRYDQQKYLVFERLIEKQLSFFWRPEEIDLTRDRIDFQKFSNVEKHIFLSNLKYQTLLDSIQGRGPNISLLPWVSLPELETWIETWSFSETIHSRSYTYILRSIFDNPSIIFDDIVANSFIRDRALSISHYYDDFIVKTQILQGFRTGRYDNKNMRCSVSMYDVKKAFYLALQAINALEAIRFYVSFACTFAFSEQKKLEGCGKIVKLIARDEALHVTGTQHMINIIHSGKDGDPELTNIAHECQELSQNIFLEVVLQEKQWAKYLFQNGSILGLNEDILCQYIDYIAKERMSAIGLIYNGFSVPKSNPIPWISTYLTSDNVQVAPQETEISSYLVGQIESSIKDKAFKDFSL